MRTRPGSRFPLAGPSNVRYSGTRCSEYRLRRPTAEFSGPGRRERPRESRGQHQVFVIAINWRSFSSTRLTPRAETKTKADLNSAVRVDVFLVMIKPPN